jgi:hypothetical protein
MSLCVLGGVEGMRLAVTAFTLAWTHSVERTAWEEDWRITTAGLELVAARVQGSGAGMEPPQGAWRVDGWWEYTPGLPPQRQLVLAASGATGDGWTLCAAGRCTELGAAAGAPLRLVPCGTPQDEMRPGDQPTAG